MNRTDALLIAFALLAAVVLGAFALGAAGELNALIPPHIG